MVCVCKDLFLSHFLSHKHTYTHTPPHVTHTHTHTHTPVSEVVTFTAVLGGPGATVTATTNTLYSVNAESPPIVIEVSLVELVVLSPGEPLG